MQNFTFASIGDIGLDIYPKYHAQFPGGMALNSAIHAARAGADASIISAVGNDPYGNELIQFLMENNVNTKGLSQLPGITDSVEIILDKNGRPEYYNWELGVLKDLTLNQRQKSIVSKQDLAISVHLPPLKTLFDSFADLKYLNGLKVGDFTDLSEYDRDINVFNEYVEAFEVFVLSIDTDLEEQQEKMKKFARKHKKMGIALLGEKGSRIFYKNEDYFCPAIKTSVVDSTGAGDAYLASFFTTYFMSRDIFSSMQYATLQASSIIKQLGAV